MLQNAYFLAKIGADTAKNEQHFAEICQKLATTLREVIRPQRIRPGSRSPTTSPNGGFFVVLPRFCARSTRGRHVCFVKIGFSLVDIQFLHRTIRLFEVGMHFSAKHACLERTFQSETYCLKYLNLRYLQQRVFCKCRR